jgi:hypothetical protein
MPDIKVKKIKRSKRVKKENRKKFIYFMISPMGKNCFYDLFSKEKKNAN